MRDWAKCLICVGILVNAQSGQAAEFIWDKRVPNSTSLYVVGEIVSGDYQRFVDAIKLRGLHPFILYLRSGGGNTQEAMRIGRLVRRLSVSTMGPAATPQNIHVANCGSDVRAIGRPSPCICASACALIWFAGTIRTSLEIYIHSIKFDAKMYGTLSPAMAGRMYQQGMDEVHTYLKEMDVNDKYYYMMTNVASADVERVPTVYGDDVSGFAPSYREWLYAKCGVPTNSNAIPWGKCTVDTGDEATVQAIREFLSSSP